MNIPIPYGRKKVTTLDRVIQVDNMVRDSRRRFANMYNSMGNLRGRSRDHSRDHSRYHTRDHLIDGSKNHLIDGSIYDVIALGNSIGCLIGNSVYYIITISGSIISVDSLVFCKSNKSNSKSKISSSSCSTYGCGLF